MNTIKSENLYIDHIVITISNIERTKEYYSKIFGHPKHEDDSSIMFNVGETKLFFGLPYGDPTAGDKFNPNRIGLEHLAFGVKTIEELVDIEKHLNEAQIIHSGIHIDSHSTREKIWFNDPDEIRMEFFLR